MFNNDIIRRFYTISSCKLLIIMLSSKYQINIREVIHMSEFSREYLELLAEKYPDEAAVCSEIINLRAILALPTGTEHFISDLHG